MRFPFLRLVSTAFLATLCACASPESEMTAAAKHFLAALNDDQRAAASFEFKSDERENWHFIPKDRKGVTLGNLKPAQKHLAFALLQSGLSNRGFSKATTIMSLEQILQELEGPNRRFARDPELYHVSIFGTPDAQGTWGWRFEGHHLSLNFTLVKGRFAAGTPSFMGTNPAEVRQGPRAGLRVLAAEEDLARELMGSLNAGQLKQALIQANAPDDILTVANRTADVGQARGLAFSGMNAAQKKLLNRIIDEYVGRLRGDLAVADLAKIDAAGRGKIRFAWAGSAQRGQRHYYRIHGPTFLLEYDNTQNDANHVHAVWRDFSNDFGRDLLKEHLEHSHQSK
ncbi:MAG: hypothetical protein RIT19_517 [Verrucomicrobiota bacterium]|jgi:hypothetical protein